LNNNPNFLIILVGLPASGKSTFAYKLKDNLEKKFQNKVKIIDPDLIRDKMFPSSFNFKNEPQIREKNLQLVRKHLTKGQIVISDDINYYSSMRHDLKLIADSLSTKFYIIYVSTPLNLCLRRNEERGKPIPNEVIENIYNKFDNFKKYKWDTPFDNFDITEIQDLNQFLENLCDRIALNLQEKEILKPSQEKHTISFREKMDLITRKVVSELLKNPKYQNSKDTIVEYRKSFIKSRTDENRDFNKILKDFKKYLNKKLKI